MYFLLGISLFFALFFVLNLSASALAAAIWRVLSPQVNYWSAQKCARISFTLRLLPTILAFVFGTAFLLPAYLLFEPYSTKEIVTIKLALPALISAVGIGIALFRVFASWRMTRRLVADWLELSEQITIKNISIPVYCIRHPFPVIAVVGAFRPRLFVARQIFDSLSEEEFQAAIAHEYGHLVARDNLKRMLIGVCRDLLLVSCGRRLDRAWTETSEASADEYAAHSGGEATALSLASALVKVARIVPQGASPAMPVGAFLMEAQTADINYRVRRLLQFTKKKNACAGQIWFGFSLSFWLSLGGFSAVILMLATNYRFLQNIHLGYEYIVNILQ
ncbi:MAG: M56 family metallopeptidase [Acidobacteriota bacterium]|nr:M56 family metallopeptidase [Acidobacteriota bacterium]